MKKTTWLILCALCLSTLSIGNYSTTSADPVAVTTVKIPDNQWKIAGTAKGKGDVEKKFSIRQSTAKVLKMGEDLKFELQAHDAQLQFSLQIPVKDNVKTAELYQFQEQPLGGEKLISIEYRIKSMIPILKS
jgi:hypothetical protein